MRASKSKTIGNTLDEGLKAMLDHVATELAEEYVQLMERAAAEQLIASSSPANTRKEDSA